MALKFSMVLQAIDRVTGPARRMQASIRSIGQGARQMGRDVARAGREATKISQLSSATMRLRGAFAAVGRAAKHWAGRAGIGSWGDAAEKAGRGVGLLLRKAGGLAAGAAKWGTAAAGAAGGFALFDLFSTAGQFEQYKIMLENMEGSGKAAQRAFDWVKNFAQTTPYELSDVMEAFVQLKGYGIDPMNGSLRSLGDASAGMSKPIMQAVEALADAMTNQYERLKEFGIRASKHGDRVSFTYRKAGKDITRTVKDSGSEIEKALTGIFTDRFGGMMDRQSKTLNGLISNLKDAWSSFLVMIADAGIFNAVKSKLEALLTKVQQWAKDGTLKAWAEDISDKLTKAFNWLTKPENLQRVADAFVSMAKAAVTLANAINSVAWFFNKTGEIAGDITSGRLAQIRRETPAEKHPRASLGQIFNDITGGGLFSIKRADSAGASPLAPAARPTRPVRQFRGASADDLNGKVNIHLQVDAKPGTGVRALAVNSDNRRVPVELKLGRTMAGVA